MTSSSSMRLYRRDHPTHSRQELAAGRRSADVASLKFHSGFRECEFPIGELWALLALLQPIKVCPAANGPLYEVSSVALPVKGGLGHRLVETSQEGLRIDGLNLDLEWLQFFLKRLGDALQSMLARGIGG